MNICEIYYWGMNLIWWMLWVILLAWIFLIPYDIPGQRNKKQSPIDVLKMRFARGDISREEYEQARSLLEKY